MSALINERFIMVTPTLVRAFGAQGAIVLQEIHFGSNDTGCEATQERIAELTGLSRDQVYRSIKKLTEFGVIEVEKRSASRGDQTSTYVINHELLPLRDSAQRSAKPLRDSAQSSSSLRTRNNKNVNESSEQQELIPSEIPETKSSKGSTRRKNGTKALSDSQRAMFELWWSGYPVRRRKADAMKAWAVALAAGVSVDELQLALNHYNESISGWERLAGVKLEFLFAAPKFIDGQFLDFVEGPDVGRWALPVARVVTQADEYEAFTEEANSWQGEVAF